MVKIAKLTIAKANNVKKRRFTCRAAVFTVSKKANPEWDPEKNREYWEEHSHVRYICGQWEKGKGEKDYIHFQGYVQFMCAIGSRKLIQEILKFKGWCDNARGNLLENINYTSKENLEEKGNRLKDTEVFILGDPVDCDGNGKGSERSDLNKIKKALDNGASTWEIANSHFSTWSRNYRSLDVYKGMVENRNIPHLRTVKVHVFYGASGCKKSWCALQLAVKGNLLSSNCPYYKPLYRKDGGLWFNKYDGEKILILEEFYGQLKFSYFLALLDSYRFECERKGGTCWAQWDTIYITSNTHPNKWYPNIPEESKVGIKRRMKSIRHFIRPGNAPVPDWPKEEIYIDGKIKSPFNYM